MAVRVPKESYVVGCERENGTLDFYALVTDPQRYDNYEEAAHHRDILNKDRRASWIKTDWQVYKMRFEAVERVTPVIEQTKTR